MPQEIQVKSILNKTRRRDPWFLDEYTINPFSGCSFNCLYCYIRGSKYGSHMEEKMSVKINAPEILERQLQLRAKKNQRGIIVLSSATDPYLQLEKDYRITRRILELILKYKFPLHIITKSDLVVRDFDLLKAIDKEAILPDDLQDKLTNKVFITFSFSTIDDTIGSRFEPGATPPTVRMETLRATLVEGFYSGVSLMPLLPYITDTADHLQQMFSRFKAIGVRYIFPASITLFGNGHADSKTLVMRAVEKYYPQLLDKYHSFFDRHDQVPAYYRNAFAKKMKEMSEEFGLRNSLTR